VLAGNTTEYVQLLFAVGGIGAIFAIINPTFTAEEVLSAIDFLGETATSPATLPCLCSRDRDPQTRRPCLLRTGSGIERTALY
jgi:hypothetical protein